MFTEFTAITGSLYKERVNTFLGIAFLATVALWAAMVIWNLTEGTNPIDRGIAAAIDKEVISSQDQ
ncbi:MAG TPA: hypothetical protein VN701_00400 [Candidatus Paceibacterota bacterium]|nr:hypothetical protein [Candidatus Paceibacterota bacterium]